MIGIISKSFACLVGLMQAAVASCNSSIDGYELDWANASNPQGNLSMVETVYRDGLAPGDPLGDPLQVFVDFGGDTQNLNSGNNPSPRFHNGFSAGRPITPTTLFTSVNHAQGGEFIDYVITFSQPVFAFTTTLVDVDARDVKNGGSGGYQDQITVMADNAGSPVPVDLSNPYAINPPGVFYPGVVHVGAPLANNTVSGRLRLQPNGKVKGTSKRHQDFGNVDISIADAVTRVVIRFSAGENFGFQSSNPQAQNLAMTEIKFCVPRHPNLDIQKSMSLHREDSLGCELIPGLPDPNAAAVIPGACIEYKINVENTGSGPATNLQLTDVLQQDLIFVDAYHLGFTIGTGFDFTEPMPGTDCGSSSCAIEIEGVKVGSGETGQILIRALLK